MLVEPLPIRGSNVPTPGLESARPSIQYVPELERLQPESNAKVKKAWSYISTALHTSSHRDVYLNKEITFLALPSNTFLSFVKYLARFIWNFIVNSVIHLYKQCVTYLFQA
jgi:hypothetical protein